MADPDLDIVERTVTPKLGQVDSHYNLNNERLDCDNIDDLTTRYIFAERPSFVTVLLRFFGNIFVDSFLAIFK